MNTCFVSLKRSTDDIRLVIDDLNTEALANIGDPSVAARHQVIANSLVVVLSGFLETFLKDCARQFMTKISARGKAFSDFPDAIQNCHYKNGGRLISDRSRNRVPWVSSTPEDLTKRMAAAVTVSPSVPLWEAFADTQSNPSATVIKEFLKDLGVGDPVSEFDRLKKAPPDWMATKLAIDSFIGARNECAHTGAIASAPSLGTVRDYADLIDHVSETLTLIAEDRLNTL